MTIVRLENVGQQYARKDVLAGVNLHLARGEVFGLVGPNGAGKTTLLRTLATIMPPHTGSISFPELPESLALGQIRRHIGYLPQTFGADPAMRLADFVRYALWIRGVARQEWDDEVALALRRVDLWEQRRDRMKSLSGGMRQRAGIAWAIVGRPGLILLDEPTIGLDPRQRLHFRNILGQLNESAVILSTHLIDDIEAACDHIAVLNNGVLQFVGRTPQFVEFARDDLPGNSRLEQAYMSFLSVEDQRL